MRLLIFLPFLFFAAYAQGADLIIGGEVRYTVRKGDELRLIGARHGVFWKNIAKENGLDPEARMIPGQEIKVTTRKIVPKVVDDGIVINIADRTLYLFKKGKLTAYPVGLGLPAEDDFGDWRTPAGKFVIVGKRKNPIWYVPESIQMEAAAKGKPVEETVPAGPKNPLGRYALQTSIPGVLIHETIRPASVYGYQSHGCIRVLPEHMETLFQAVERGTKGELIYEPFKVAVDESGRVYLEVRTDTYKRAKSVKEAVWKVIDGKGLSGRVDAVSVEKTIKEQSGIAEDVTIRPVQARVADEVKPLFRRFFDLFKASPKKGKAGLRARSVPKG